MVLKPAAAPSAVLGNNRSAPAIRSVLQRAQPEVGGSQRGTLHDVPSDRLL